jgi:hypothetical protein
VGGWPVSSFYFCENSHMLVARQRGYFVAISVGLEPQNHNLIYIYIYIYIFNRTMYFK